MADRRTGILRPLTKRFPRLFRNQDLHRKLRDALSEAAAASHFLTVLMQPIIRDIIMNVILLHAVKV